MRGAVVRAAALAAGLLLSAPAARGQAPPPLDLPSQRPEELPIPGPAPEPESAAPLAPAPEALPGTALPELRVRVRAIEITGNTVLPAAALREIVAPTLGRELTTDEIEALRQRITLRYAQSGYVTSGAVIPDQDLAGGVLRIQIVEGRLARVELSGNRRFRSGYLRQRIAPDPDAPLDVLELERRLQLLQSDPQIRAVHAELRPGLALGTSVLRVRIDEAPPVSLTLGSSNDRSPVIGSTTGEVTAGVRNLAGWGDRLEVRGELGETLRYTRSRYAIPFTRWDTELALDFRYASSRVVESPFDDLDIESDFLSGGVELSQPLWHTLSDEVRVGLLAEWRRGRNTIDGYGFSFSDGPDRGVSIVAPLRPFVEWVRRGRSQVFAVRGQLSVGLPVLGYTDVPGAVANGTFVVGLLQAQWARRFDALRGIEVVARTDLQVSADPLLPIEQFALGGHASVRGYREDELVADNGFDASLELRLPLWRRPDGTAVLQLAPFADVGRAWEDEERPDAFGKTLASVGLGLRWFPWPWLRSELYWGYRIEHVPDPHDSLQDQGLQFRVVGTVF